MKNREISMDKRVLNLERINRLMVSAICGSALFFLLGAAAEPGPVRAQAFQLVDADGNVRAELTTNNEATGLFVHDDSGTVRIGIAHFAHGGSGVALHGPDSRGAAVLYLKGEGSLRFFDAEGNVTDQVPAIRP